MPKKRIFFNLYTTGKKNGTKMRKKTKILAQKKNQKNQKNKKCRKNELKKIWKKSNEFYKISKRKQYLLAAKRVKSSGLQ